MCNRIGGGEALPLGVQQSLLVEDRHATVQNHVVHDTVDGGKVIRVYSRVRQWAGV